MSKIQSAFSRAINKRIEQSQKRRRVGLSWVKEKLLKHDESTSLKCHKLFGHSLYYISAQDLLHGIKEIFIDECYKISLGNSPYIIDCGGNIGLSVLYFSKQYPNAEIVTFEPDRINYSLLQRNIQSFDLKNVTLRDEAIWCEDTILNFAGEGSLASSISNPGSLTSYQVKATRLEKFLDRKVDLLKLDIEGAEYEVMKDIAPKLSIIDNIFLEYHSTFDDEYKLVELLDIVRKSGFRFYIKEVFSVYPTPFFRGPRHTAYDIQLNVYCFRK